MFSIEAATCVDTPGQLLSYRSTAPDDVRRLDYQAMTKTRLGTRRHYLMKTDLPGLKRLLLLDHQ